MSNNWYPAPSLVHLDAELEHLHPRRGKAERAADGLVSSAAHRRRSPSSDHDPDSSSRPPGIVRAKDTTHAPGKGVDCERLVAYLLGRCRSGKETRIQYIIWDGYIYNAQKFWPFRKAFAKRRYTGTNPHNHHCHVSIKRTWSAERGTNDWLPDYPATKADVKSWQVRYNYHARPKVPLTTDGICGPRTLAALRGE